MTNYTGPLVVTSAAGDGSETARVSANGQISTDAGISVTGTIDTADLAITGTLSAANHSLAASAISLELPTALEASAGNGGAVPATAAGYISVTINGSAYAMPFFMVAT